ncbi:replication/maintenance protein RepL [Streptomyces sp. NPDC102406]|uniref:replication/maintenance protein RepL n=1 Tax=Streptomyces sp. NPDC102406 TaxID=3366171 RepID=UPI0037F2DD35
MTSDPPEVEYHRPRALPAEPSALAFGDILTVLGQQLGETVEDQQKGRRRKLKGVSFEYDHEPRTVHDMAGDAGYSITSNWFVQRLAQLAIAKQVTKSEMCVFLYVAGGQMRGTGIAHFTQQEITNGLNVEARRVKGATQISRSTVTRAIKALCEYGWLERHGNGAIRLNVRLWFNGNSSAQQDVLADIQKDHGDTPQSFGNYIGPVPQQEQLTMNFEDEELSPQERAG